MTSPSHVRFTKNPVTIEAFQMTKERRMDNSDWPQWLHEAWQDGTLHRQDPDAAMPDILIAKTLEGQHIVSWNDWIIRGVKGELYPCKPDIFEATYSPADTSSPSHGAQTTAEALTELRPWGYCPECGSTEIHYEQGDHKQCVCGQEWFADLDYTGVVRKHLAEWFSASHSTDLLTARSQIEALTTERDNLRKVIAGCDWYWPADDTSSDACADSPYMIAENCSLKEGEVIAYSRGGVVETRYYAFLTPADDSDTDDDFEADATTEAEVQAAIAEELERRRARAALNQEAPSHD